jgi:hypothetical protein
MWMISDHYAWAGSMSRAQSRNLQVLGSGAAAQGALSHLPEAAELALWSPKARGAVERGRLGIYLVEPLAPRTPLPHHCQSLRARQ